MDPDLSALEEYLDDAGLDGYLVDADSADSTQRYLSGFDAPDPFTTVYTPDTTAILVSALEFGRAKTDSRADDVSRLADYDYRELASEHGSEAAAARVVAAWLDDLGLDEAPPVWANREREGEPTLFVCRSFTCSPPVTDIEAALEWADDLAP